MVKLLVGVLALTAVSFADLVTSSTVNGVTTNSYKFTPATADFGTISHDDAKSWGINLDLAEGEVIKSATLEISGVYNWHPNEWNALYITLLEDASLGITKFDDKNYGWDVTANKNKWGYYLWNDVPGKEDDYFVNADGIALDRLNYNNGLFSNAGDIIVQDGSAITNYIQYQNADGSQVWSGDVSIPTYKATINFTSTEIAALSNYLADNNFGFGVDADCHFYGKYTFTMTTQKTTNVPEPTLLSLLGAGLLGLAFFRRKK